MILRWITGLVFAMVALAALWWGTYAWGGLLVVLLGLAAIEWRTLGELDDITLPVTLVLGWLLFLLAFSQMVFLAFLPLLLIFPAISVLGRQQANISRNMIWTAAGLIWLSLPAALLYLTRSEFGWLVLGLLLLATILEDTFALYGGMLFGGERPFAPGISPNKTWAGGIFAVSAATAVIVAGGIYFQWPLHLSLSLGLLLGVTGQLGDLSISALKRQSGLDDTGSFFPGHGGILDRVDGLVLNVSIFYPFCFWIVQTS